MITMTRLLLASAVVLTLAGVGRAQQSSPNPPRGASTQPPPLVAEGTTPTALPDPLPTAPDTGVGGGVLQALPQPRDLPASLFAPPPPPTSRFLRVDSPYFIRDRLLDGPESQPPGWFGGVELQVLKPHVLSGLSGNVQNKEQRANGTSTNVALPNAPLDWTVSPRVFLGYRLPSGFGGFMVSYRNLQSAGGGSASGANGTTSLKSHLAFNIIDFDYNSNELSLGPQWDMKWTVGIRSLFMFYDSQYNQSYGQAAAGNGVFAARDYNNVAAVGPHVALELDRHLGDSGWALSFRTDLASLYDGSHVGFLTRSSTLGSNGLPLPGATRYFGAQDTPIVNVRAGITWQSSRNSATRFFLGYQYEHFWALDRLPPTGNNPPSVGQVWDQGIILQATFHY